MEWLESLKNRDFWEKLPDFWMERTWSEYCKSCIL